MHLRLATFVSLLSGFVALGYEILWARRLADIIGATALASSLVVGVFFLALAAGAVCIGPRASRHASPWRLYGWLELGILVTILPSFFGEHISGLLARAFGPVLLHPQAGIVVKSLLALVFVGPPSFFMGGTLPALGQAAVARGRLGREGNAIYGVNTLGGAAGILVTTFAFIPALGVRGAFLILMACSLVLAVLGLRIGGVQRAVTSSAAARPGASRAASSRGQQLDTGTKPARGASIAEPAASWTPGGSAWSWVALLSGFIVLGYEILALHLFSQVLHNSSYTFASVLVVVIAALSVGALATQRAVIDERRAWQRLALVLLLAACSTAILARFFVMRTGGMLPFGGGADGFWIYIARVLGSAALVLGPPFVLAGWVFPLVLAGAGAAALRVTGQAHAASRPTGHEVAGSIGSTWGRLLGMNAAGALLGLLCANHLAMPRLGLWGSLTAWCLLILAGGIVTAARLPDRRRRSLLFGLAAVAVVLLALAAPWSLPVAHLDPDEHIVASRSGSAGVSAVIEQPHDRRIKWNNTYSLGGSANTAQQTRMGLLPLLLHPEPRRVAFIGAATGITASAALRDPRLESLTAIELSAQTMQLACEYFRDWNVDLCRHPRAHPVVEDGRMYFRATREQFDVVVADLFVPWRSGAANLYTREHFEAVAAHLRPGGIFAQWLPLFQLDARGFWGIATTFCAVFPNAWLAIADFQPSNPGVALIGWRTSTSGGSGDASSGGGPQLGPDANILAQRCRELGSVPELREPLLRDPSGVALFLVGPVRAALPPGIPIMTLDRPWLADHAPRVQRQQPPHFFVGPELVTALQHIARQAPPGPLRQHVLLGQQLYAFCDVFEREGLQRASSWYEANVTATLPHAFVVPNAAAMSWPFSEQPGMFLIRRAFAQARSTTPTASP